MKKENINKSSVLSEMASAAMHIEHDVCLINADRCDVTAKPKNRAAGKLRISIAFCAYSAASVHFDSVLHASDAMHVVDETSALFTVTVVIVT